MKKLLLIFFLCVSFHIHFGQDLTTGLMACYSFNGNANDGSGNGFDGTISGAISTFDRFGNPNSAYAYNGINNFISLPNASIKDSKEFSISVWAYAETIPGLGESTTVISVSPPDLKHNGITLTNNYSSNFFTGWTAGGFNNGNPANTSMTTNVLPLSKTWYHLVFVRNLTEGLLYVNGVLMDTDVTGGTPPYFYANNSTLMYLGLRVGSIQPFYGAIDDLAVYNRSLSVQEVQSLFSQSLTCNQPPPIPTPSVNNVTICEGISASISATGGTAYKWYDAQTGGNLLFQGNIFTTPPLTTSTSYFVSNYANDQESSRTKATVTVNINPKPNCLDGNTYINQPFVIKLSATDGTQPISYAINFENGDIVTTGNNEVTYVFSKPGNQSVSIIATDANNCSAQCLSQIAVNNGVFIPNIISANNDSYNDRLTIYTKDVSGYYRILEGSGFQLTIINRWGLEIFKTSNVFEGWEAKNVDAGTYYYILNFNSSIYKGWISIIN